MLHLTISGVIPIALISICCVMFTVNDSEVVDCGHELTLLLSLFLFLRRECPSSRRRPTVPKLLSITIRQSCVCWPPVTTLLKCLLLKINIRKILTRKMRTVISSPIYAHTKNPHSEKSM